MLGWARLADQLVPKSSPYLFSFRVNRFRTINETSSQLLGHAHDSVFPSSTSFPMSSVFFI
jgi:hypothetical protein